MTRKPNGIKPLGTLDELPAAVYARDADRSCTDQIAACRRYIEEVWPGRDVVVFEDVGSASRPERPGFRALLSTLRAGAVGALVVSEMDRLTRSETEHFTTLAPACTEAGITHIHIAGLGIVKADYAPSLPAVIKALWTDELRTAMAERAKARAAARRAQP
jgi:DNA invertase Pin-like site-specific DNA recombinase